MFYNVNNRVFLFLLGFKKSVHMKNIPLKCPTLSLSLVLIIDLITIRVSVNLILLYNTRSVSCLDNVHTAVLQPFERKQTL